MAQRDMSSSKTWSGDAYLRVAVVVCLIAVGFGAVALLAPALPLWAGKLVSSLAPFVFVVLILVGDTSALIWAARTKRRLVALWLLSSLLWVIAIGLFAWGDDRKPLAAEFGEASRLPVGEAIGVPRILSAQAAPSVPALTLLVVGSAIILMFKVIAGSIKRANESAREDRDQLALRALGSPIPYGTPIASIPSSNAWRLSAKARTGELAGLSEPANPWWQDAPTMNEAWWALATAPEEELEHWRGVILAQSRRSFRRWLDQTRAADPATYAAYVHWRQQEELLKQQRVLAAQQQQMLAGQQALRIEQRRTTNASQNAANATAAASSAARERWARKEIRDQTNWPR